MIPYVKDGKGRNMSWFKDKGLDYIAKFFILMEKNLLGRQIIDSEKIDYPCDPFHIANIIGLSGASWKNYELSGQCIIANFGFVREQSMHMNYLPVQYH